MSALTKADLVERLIDDIGLNRHDSKQLVDDFFEEIRAALESGEEVKISGFGNFTIRDKPERPGRNPKTRVDIPIEARRVVTFRPGSLLRGRVHRSMGEQEAVSEPTPHAVSRKKAR